MRHKEKAENKAFRIFYLLPVMAAYRSVFMLFIWLSFIVVANVFCKDKEIDFQDIDVITNKIISGVLCDKSFRECQNDCEQKAREWRLGRYKDYGIAINQYLHALAYAKLMSDKTSLNYFIVEIIDTFNDYYDAINNNPNEYKHLGLLHREYVEKHAHFTVEQAMEKFSPKILKRFKVEFLKLEVDFNFDPLNFQKAQEYASLLGNGWRLPTIKELKSLCIDAKQIIKSSIDYDAYWSQDEHSTNLAHVLSVNTCGERKFHKNEERGVLSVRSI